MISAAMCWASAGAFRHFADDQQLVAGAQRIDDRGRDPLCAGSPARRYRASPAQSAASDNSRWVATMSWLKIVRLGHELRE